MSKQVAAIFSKETVDFLKALKANNDRDWFNANKPRYERVLKQPTELFCSEMTARLRRLTGIAHNAKVYRIHRDVRFSKDKTPYSAHLHVSFVPETERPSPPAWMFGVDPQCVAIGVGCIAFDKPGLDAFRNAVDGGSGARLSKLLAALRKEGVRVSEPELKRVPAPFAGDHPRADLLRRKGLSVWIDIDDPYAISRIDFADRCETHFKRLKPLFSWMIEHGS
jgi:uncharacterized protein (TIGR02453 family)